MDKQNLVYPFKTMGFPGSSDGKESACNARHPGSIPGLGRSLQKEMATYATILAQKIPRTEQTGGVGGWATEELDTTEKLTHFQKGWTKINNPNQKKKKKPKKQKR